MSAFGGKADVVQGVAECPLIANSGRKLHSQDDPIATYFISDKIHRLDWNQGVLVGVMI